MDDHIKAEGWHNWDNRDNERTARYKEYGSTGAGSNAANRVKWSSILTKNEASQITVQAVLSGTDGWNPEKGKELVSFRQRKLTFLFKKPLRTNVLLCIMNIFF